MLLQDWRASAPLDGNYADAEDNQVSPGQEGGAAAKTHQTNTKATDDEEVACETSTTAEAWRLLKHATLLAGFVLIANADLSNFEWISRIQCMFIAYTARTPPIVRHAKHHRWHG